MLDQRVDPNAASGIMEPRFHPPGDKAVNNRSALSGKATVTVAAGTNGEKRVVTGFSFSLGSAVMLAAGTIGAFIIDGTTGGTNYLWQEVLGIGTTGAQSRLSGLNIVASENTALTIEFSAGVTNGTEAVNLTYHTIGGIGGT